MCNSRFVTVGLYKGFVLLCDVGVGGSGEGHPGSLWNHRLFLVLFPLPTPPPHPHPIQFNFKLTDPPENHLEILIRIVLTLYSGRTRIFSVLSTQKCVFLPLFRLPQCVWMHISTFLHKGLSHLLFYSSYLCFFCFVLFLAFCGCVNVVLNFFSPKTTPLEVVLCCQILGVPSQSILMCPQHLLGLTTPFHLIIKNMLL